jgi:ubiquinone/menaquinone biosynthesis C-methylase UbiE
MFMTTSRRFRIAFTLLLGLGLVLWGGRHASIEALQQMAGRLQPSILLLTLGLGWVVTGLRAARFSLFYPAPGRKTALYGSFAMMRFLSFVVPFRGGELIGLALLKKHKLIPTVQEVLPVWAVLRVADVCSLTLLLFVAAWVNPVDPRYDVFRSWFPLAVLGCTVVFAGGAWWFLRRNLDTVTGRWGKFLRSLHEGTRRLHSMRRMSGCALYSLLLWAGMAAVIAGAESAFSGPLDFGEAFSIGCLLLGISLLPVHTPLGIGTVDASLASLLYLAGLETEQAIALALCMRLVLTGIVLLDGWMGGVLLAMAPDHGKPTRNACENPNPYEVGLNAQRKYYAENAHTYDTDCFGNRDNRSHFAKYMRLSERMNLRDGMRVLEIGAGTGVHGAHMLSRHDLSYTGIDLSPEMIDLAKVRLGDRADLLTSPAEELPFPDGSFDAVFCCAVIHHLSDKAKGVSEMVRVVKPGGKVVMCEPNPLNPLNIRQWLLIPEEKGQTQIRRKNFQAWLEYADARLESMEYLNYTPPGPPKWASFLNQVDRMWERVPICRRIGSVVLFTATRREENAQVKGESS